MTTSTCARIRRARPSTRVRSWRAPLVLLTSVTLVCAAPGLTASTSPTGVSVYDCRGLTVRPSSLTLTCDGPPDYVIDGTTYPGSGGRLTGLQWSQWGPTQARGTGRLALSTRADGVYQRLRVTVVLDQVRTQSGDRVFTRAATQADADSERNTWPLARWRGR